MTDHNTEIRDIKSEVKKINSTLYGNGQKGMKVVVAELSIGVKNLTASNDKIASVLNGIWKFQQDWEIREQEHIKYKAKQAEDNKITSIKIEKKKVNIRWTITTLIAVIFGLATMLISFKSDSNKERVKIKQQDREVNK